jgi:hypothetical protein
VRTPEGWCADAEILSGDTKVRGITSVRTYLPPTRGLPKSSGPRS